MLHGNPDTQYGPLCVVIIFYDSINPDAHTQLARRGQSSPSDTYFLFRQFKPPRWEHFGVSQGIAGWTRCRTKLYSLIPVHFWTEQFIQNKWRLNATSLVKSWRSTHSHDSYSNTAESAGDARTPIKSVDLTSAGEGKWRSRNCSSVCKRLQFHSITYSTGFVRLYYQSRLPVWCLYNNIKRLSARNCVSLATLFERTRFDWIPTKQPFADRPVRGAVRPTPCIPVRIKVVPVE